MCRAFSGSTPKTAKESPENGKNAIQLSTPATNKKSRVIRTQFLRHSPEPPEPLRQSKVGAQPASLQCCSDALSRRDLQLANVVKFFGADAKRTRSQKDAAAHRSMQSLSSALSATLRLCARPNFAILGTETNPLKRRATEGTEKTWVRDNVAC